MAGINNTYTRITTVNAGGTNSIDFTSIASTYTDLKIVLSGSYTGNNYIKTIFNNDSGSNYIYKVVRGTGSAVGSFKETDWTSAGLVCGYVDTGWSTLELYVSGYANSTAAKTISIDCVQEANSSTAYSWIGSGYWSGTSAINRVTITLQSNGNFAAGTTATLYGISNNTTASTALATGGTITYNSNYIYHTFLDTGTFTPVSYTHLRAHET